MEYPLTRLTTRAQGGKILAIKLPWPMAGQTEDKMTIFKRAATLNHRVRVATPHGHSRVPYQRWLGAAAFLLRRVIGAGRDLI